MFRVMHPRNDKALPQAWRFADYVFKFSQWSVFASGLLYAGVYGRSKVVTAFSVLLVGILWFILFRLMQGFFFMELPQRRTLRFFVAVSMSATLSTAFSAGSFYVMNFAVGEISRAMHTNMSAEACPK